MYKYILTFLMIATLSGLQAQNFELSGIVKDPSGEPLAFAIVGLDSTSYQTSSDLDGKYTLTAPKGKYILRISSMGYGDYVQEVNLNKDTQLDIGMKEQAIMMEAFEIEAVAEDKNVESTEMSVEELDIETIKKIPAVMGEVDIVKTLTLLPGIQSAGEGVGGFFVRGGNYDQNLILFDEAPIYNGSHFFGFFSVFNPEAVQGMKIYKGGIPAAYGGRLSSLLDVSMREGSYDKLHGSGGIGLISSRLTLEGPIVKDKLSFLVSGRRTYADVFLKLSPNEDLRDNVSYFYDLNGKLNWKIGKKDMLSYSGYYGRDVFKVANVFQMNWGNATSTLDWKHDFSEKLYSDVYFIFNQYDYGLGVPEGLQAFEWSSSIRDFTLKTDWTLLANDIHTFKFGISGTHHTFKNGEFIPKGSQTIFNPIRMEKDYAYEYGVYAQDEFKVTDNLLVNYGLRYSLFNLVGPGTIYEYGGEDGTELISSRKASNGESIKTYSGLEPRLSARYKLNAKSSVKLSYNRMNQYIHLLSNSSVSSPFDIWISSSENIKPQISDQIAGGYFRNFKDNTYEASVELFYKHMQNQIDYKDNADLFLNEQYALEMLVGKGWSYGSEFMVRKNKGKLTGWLSYTLSKTQRQVEGINNGEPYSPTYDRRHDISIVGMYEINERWDIGLTWVYTSGKWATFPVGEYFMEDIPVQRVTERNGFKLRDYHRLDLSANYYFKQKEGKKVESSLNFSIYNVYWRKNPFSIDFRTDEDTGQTDAYMIYLFGIVPSITWNFQF